MLTDLPIWHLRCKKDLRLKIKKREKMRFFSLFFLFVLKLGGFAIFARIDKLNI